MIKRVHNQMRHPDRHASREWMPALLFAAMVLLVVVPMGAVSAWANSQQNILDVPHVLIVNSYHPGYPWTERLENTVIAGLEAQYPGVDISSEYLDWKRHPGEQTLEAMVPLMRMRYQDEPPDAVVTTDDAALSFVLTQRDALFPGVPVVFCGVSEPAARALLATHENLWGVAQQMDVEGTIRLAMDTIPDITRAKLVYENSETGTPIGVEAESLFHRLYPGVSVEAWNELPAVEIRQRAEALQPGDMVLYLTYNRDTAGNVLPTHQYADYLFAACPVPVFGLYDFVVGHGVLGGSVIDATQHAGKVTELVIRLLEGHEPVDGGLVTEKQTSPLFDYDLMTLLEVPVTALPESAVILNRPSNVFRDNRELFLGILSVFVFLILLTAGLLLNIRRRTRAEQQLKASHEELVSVNEQMAAVNAALLESDGELRERNERLADQKRLIETSEERYRLVMEATRDAIWDWDIQSDRLVISDRFHEIFGLSGAGTHRMDDWLSRVHPDERTHVDAELQRHLAEKRESWSAEYRVRTVQGESLWILSRGMTMFDKAGQPIRLVGTHADITETKRQRDTITHMAYHDMLTGLPNRTMMKNHVTSMIRFRPSGRACVAVLFSDLDNFKGINDTFGHPVGDKILKAMSDRFQDTVGNQAVIGRMGGDEFAILLEDDETGGDAEHVAKRVLDAFSEPLLTDGMQFHLTMSIGISLYPRDGRDFDSLLRSADTAMYAAKRAGKNQFRRFDADMDGETRDRYQLENGLRNALAHGELSLHFQPVHQVDDGALHGFEALLRWHSPELGQVPPVRFIPVAEETGLILPIGTWVLQEACRFCRRLQDHTATRDICVGVNVSVLQLMQADFPVTAIQAVRDAGISPASILLEITESVLMETFAQNAGKLDELASAGFRIALDDFGTGYSSLTYLQQLPIQVLKIDKSFIDDIRSADDQASHTGAIIRLARDWGMSVVAEGVERDDQLAYLQRHRCTMLQGYLISHPLPEVDAEAYALAHGHGSVPGRGA